MGGRESMVIRSRQGWRFWESFASEIQDARRTKCSDESGVMWQWRIKGRNPRGK